MALNSKIVFEIENTGLVTQALHEFPAWSTWGTSIWLSGDVCRQKIALPLTLPVFRITRLPECRIGSQLARWAGFAGIVAGLRAAGRLSRLAQDKLCECRFRPRDRRHPCRCKEQSA